MDKNTFINGTITLIIIMLFFGGVLGEAKCIVKAVRYNWEPIGKAEIIYTASAFFVPGVVVGWLNIEDK